VTRVAGRLGLGFALLVALACAERVATRSADTQATQAVPTWDVDPFWPRLPDGLTLGQVSGVAVDGECRSSFGGDEDRPASYRFRMCVAIARKRSFR
jgi:hypothetical protein